MGNNEAWYRACMEIIDRCVAPDMYANARAMLEMALDAAQNRNNPPTNPPFVYLSL